MKSKVQSQLKKQRMIYLVICLLALSAFGTFPSIHAEEFKTFNVDGYMITVDNPHVVSLELDWGSGDMPSGSLVLDKVITDKVTLQIPKEMPMTTNLDFGIRYYALQSNGHSSLPARLLESDYFYFLEIPVRNSDKITIGSTSPAAGRTAVIENLLQPVLENCACQISDDACMQPRLKFQNSTHYIDNNDCKWRLLAAESDCGPGTTLQNGVCAVNDNGCQPDMYGSIYCDVVREDGQKINLKNAIEYFFGRGNYEREIHYENYLIFLIIPVTITLILIWRKRK